MLCPQGGQLHGRSVLLADQPYKQLFPYSLLVQVGAAYEACRAEIMLQRVEGLTDTYNRFNDQGEQSEDITRLRGLQVEMDQIDHHRAFCRQRRGRTSFSTTGHRHR